MQNVLLQPESCELLESVTQEVVDAPSLEVFKNWLDKFMDNNKSWLLTQPMKPDDDDDVPLCLNKL